VLAAVAVGAAMARAILSREADERQSIIGKAERALIAPPDRPFMVFQSLIPGPKWGRIALASLASADGARYVTDLACARVHFAAGRGVCLTADLKPVPSYTARIFNKSFEPLYTVPLTGPPSRARLSPDGRWAAVTVFEQGHSYADTGFSTRTTLLDTGNGKPVTDLEQFTVWRDGKRFRSVDFNFWGVTFARDSDRFFATLASGDVFYLVEGSVAAKEARVVLAGVECPSLSPDNTRIAFKKRVRRGLAFEWQLWLLELSTMAQRPLAGEARSIDDQVEWLDDTHVVYQFPSTDGNNIWRVTTADSRQAERFISDAWSPAVVR
jgi:hypothetical protein